MKRKYAYVCEAISKKISKAIKIIEYPPPFLFESIQSRSLRKNFFYSVPFTGIDTIPKLSLREFIQTQDLFIRFRKEVNVTIIIIIIILSTVNETGTKNDGVVSRRFHVGFQLVYTSKETSDTARETTKSRRGSDEWRGVERVERMNGGKRERETETENGRKSEEARRQESESASERGKNGGERERGRNVSSSSLPPRIQSHRVYSSVHLILFIGFKAFAGTPYLRI